MFLSHRPLGTSDDLDFKLDLICSESFILFRKMLCVQTWALYSVKILDQGKKKCKFRWGEKHGRGHRSHVMEGTCEVSAEKSCDKGQGLGPCAPVIDTQYQPVLDDPEGLHRDQWVEA